MQAHTPACALAHVILRTFKMTIRILPSMSMGDQDSDNVNITGGLIEGIEDLAVADGGTGASTPEAARQNLQILGEDESFFLSLAYRC